MIRRSVQSTNFLQICVAIVVLIWIVLLLKSLHLRHWKEMWSPLGVQRVIQDVIVQRPV